MDQKEKLEKLEEVKLTLKNEFVGIDLMIDQVIDAVKSWYLSPGLLDRPTVINLWGMTGTGKTSLVRRMMSLMGEDPLYFDTGTCIEDGMNEVLEEFSDENDSIRKSSYTGSPLRHVLIFDEFQYANTIEKKGMVSEENPKVEIRAIWNLIDSGLVDFNTSANWEINQVKMFIKRVKSILPEISNIKVSKGLTVTDRKDVFELINLIGFTEWRNRFEHISDTCKEFGISSTPTYEELEEVVKNIREKKKKKKDSSGDFKRASDNPEDPLEPLTLLSQSRLSTLSDILNHKEEGFGTKEINGVMWKEWTFGEFYEWLSKLASHLKTCPQLNFSKSLIFIIGNLDEAYTVSRDVSPDVDADILHDISNTITINDIKTALLDRFRPEQVARLGNNLIKYPTLSKSSFFEIIRREVNKVVDGLKDTLPNGATLTVDDSVCWTIYSEGVYPSQGTRPTLSTVSSVIVPTVVSILPSLPEGVKSIHMESSSGNNDRIMQSSVTLKFTVICENGDVIVKEIPYDTTLGYLRNTKLKKKSPLISIHEAGHALLYAHEYGKAPKLIVSVSTDGGGFCMTYDKERDMEISSIRELYSDVRVSLAGIKAEKLMLGERSKNSQELVLLGSGSDLDHVWSTLSHAYYRLGIHGSAVFANEKNSSWIREGVSDEYVITQVEKRIEAEEKYVSKVLTNDRELLLAIARELYEKGKVLPDKFMELVREYGSVVTEEFMENQREVFNFEKLLAPSKKSEKKTK